MGLRDPIKRRAYVREWRQRTIDERRRVAREYQRRRYASPGYRAQKRRWREANPGRAARNYYRWWLQRTYGLTVDEYSALVIAQQGQCAICEMATPDLEFDHCHTTLRRRGLLCPRCNFMLGAARDSLEILGRTIAFLGMGSVHAS